MNIAYQIGQTPEFDRQNKYYIQAKRELNQLSQTYDEDAANSFINDICYIRATGAVGPIEMLKCIHYWSDKNTRKNAFKKYYKYLENTHYYIKINDDGEERQIECSKYVAHHVNNQTSC